MNWIKQNIFLTALLAITIIVCGASGYYALNRGAAAQKATKDHLSDRDRLGALFRAEVYPSPENDEQLGREVERVRSETAALLDALATQYPVPVGGDPAAFGQRVQREYGRLRAAWEEAGVEVPDNFFLGFDAYRQKIDAPAAAIDELDYQLALVVDLVESAIGYKITKINRLSRIDRVRFEDGPPPPSGDQDDSGDKPAPYHSYAMDFDFTGHEESVRAMINHISGSGSHFLRVRAVLLANEAQEGPKREDVRNRLDRQRPATAGGAANLFVDIFGGGNEERPLTDAERLFGGGPDNEPATPGEAVDVPDLKPVFPKPGAKDAVEFLGGEQVKAKVRFELLIFDPAEKKRADQSPDSEDDGLPEDPEEDA